MQDLGQKKIKTETKPENQVFIQFLNINGEKVANEMAIKFNTGTDQLSQILKQITPKSQSEKFTFLYQNYEIQNNLNELVREFSNKEIFSEKTLNITFYEDNLIDVKPITRISSSLEGHTEAVLSVQFSPDSNFIASVSGDKTVRLWDANFESPYCVLEGHKSWSMLIQWSPDSLKFVTAEMTGDILFWTMKNIKENKKELDKLRREQSKKKKLVYNHLLKGHKNFINGISWRPFHLEENSSKFVSASKDGTVRFWDGMFGKCYAVGARHLSSVTGIIWSGQDHIYSISQDKMVIVWNSSGQHIKALQGHAHWINCMSLNTHYALKSAHFFPTNQVKEENNKSQALKFYNKSYSIFNKDILVTGSDDKTLILWAPLEKEPQLKRLTGHVGPINHVMFAPNGIIFVSASFDKTLRVWSVHESKCLAVLKAHVSEVYLLSFSHDSKWVISGSKDSTLQVWSMREKKRAYQLPGHADEIYGVDWSVDGMKMVSGGKDKMVRIWKN